MITAAIPGRTVLRVATKLHWMNATSLRALILAAIVAPILGWSVLRVWRSAALATVVQLIGALGLAIVVAAHVCEGLRLLPRMGWGEPDSIGHYLDLSGMATGLTLLPLGYLLSRRRNP